MKLLAPNGKPSNLTPEQYRLVRTSAFKKWFGDWENSPETASKVVDFIDYNDLEKEYTNEPIVVYHGTTQNFTIFNKEKIGQREQGWFGAGFYFGESKIKVKRYGNNIFTCFLNIRKPFYFTGSQSEFAYKFDIDYHKNENFGELITKKLIENGFDGLIIESVWGKEYIVFNPNQIKLADGSNTTFDSNNHDIRFDKGGKVTESQKNKLLELSIKKYGKDRVEKALKLLYKWTRGDVFKYKISDFEPLSLFKPIVYPDKIYKGIREEIAGKSGWYGKDKDYQKSIRKTKEMIVSKYKGKLSSWSKNPRVAVKFATSNGVLIMDKPNKNDIIIDTTLIPNIYKFTGNLKTNSVLLSSNIYVPQNEEEVLVVFNESSIKKLRFHEVQFNYGEYLGDYSVDTLGLTKSRVTWHVSPFENGGELAGEINSYKQGGQIKEFIYTIGGL